MQRHESNNFDFTRVVAALLVLLGHQYLLGGLQEPRLYGLYSLGDFGVTLFFSISGFLVAQSWNADPNLGRFAGRRALRIWPGLVVAVLSSALLLGPLMTPLSLREYFSHPQFWSYLSNVLLPTRWELPVSFMPGRLEHTVNGSLWTIALEVACYVGFAVLCVAGLARRPWFMAALCLVSAAYYLGLLVPLNWADHPWHRHALKLEFITYFFAGAAWFNWRRAFVDPRLLRRALVAVAALHATALVLDKPLLALWSTVPFAVLAFGLASTPVLRRFSRFGDLSYGIYLYAFPVQQTLIWLLHDRLPFAALLAVSVAVSCVLALLSWHLVEKRALALKPRRPREAGVPLASRNLSFEAP